MLSATLRCPDCGWQTTAGSVDVQQRLRAIGLLRRAPDPPDDLVEELLKQNLNRLRCDHCGSVGLKLGEAIEDAGDWEQVIACEVCRKPIPPERLEVFPDSKRCTACQQQADEGVDHAPPDFCPKCGSLVELRQSRGSGITRYKRFCTGDPPCRL